MTHILLLKAAAAAALGLSQTSTAQERTEESKLTLSFDTDFTK